MAWCKCEDCGTVWQEPESEVGTVVACPGWDCGLSHLVVPDPPTPKIDANNTPQRTQGRH